MTRLVRAFCALLVAVASTTKPLFAQTPEGENQEPARAEMASFSSVKEAGAVGREASSFAQSLSGNWKFHWVGRLSDRPGNFFQPDFDDRAWPTIPVPSCWELQGYGIPAPISASPSDTGDSNPVGSYRTEFAVPKSWDGRQVSLRFGGVSGAFSVWVNGQRVGSFSDSQNPAEFSLSQYLKPGRNLLAVTVLSKNDGISTPRTGPHLSGIFRDVWLLSTPNVHIRDFWTRAELDRKYEDATLKTTLWLQNLGKATSGACKVEVGLYDAEGKRLELTEALIDGFGGGKERKIELSVRVNNPRKWSAETPHLYTVVLALKDTQGQVLEATATRFGFRKIEWQGGVVKLNGQPIKLLGVNRYEHDSDTGRTVSMARMLQDIKLMKRFNINAVRCADGPSDPRWYDLCDRFGLYVIDETNAHNGPERAERMVQNHKNHPSVLIWSLGNKADPGVNSASLSNLLHRLDPTRPVLDTDLESALYPTVDAVVSAGKQRSGKPLFVGAYAHAMGNAVGNLAEYMIGFESAPRNLGGCIESWVDQGLTKRGPGGEKFIAYGGDYDETPNAGNFWCNGLVPPDRTVTPKLYEVKKCYQRLEIALADAASTKVIIRNKFAFTPLQNYTGTWTLLEDGKPIQRGGLGRIDVAPGQELSVRLPLRRPATLKAGAEYFVTVSFQTTQKTEWADVGHEIAWQQLALDWKAPAAPLIAQPALDPKGQWVVNLQKYGAGRVAISRNGADFEFVFNRETGVLERLTQRKKTVIAGRGLTLNMYRALTDNDSWLRGAFYDSGLSQLHTTVRAFSYRTTPAAVTVRVRAEVLGFKSNGFLQETIYTLHRDGTVLVNISLTPIGTLPPLPRLGVRFGMPGAFAEMSWFGRGPSESYPDRKSAMDIGLWSGKVRDQYVAYVRPQENGNKEDCRWTALLNAQRMGLLIVAEDAPLAMAASHFLPEDLDHARHRSGQEKRYGRLVPRAETFVTIDAKQMGLGNASRGPEPREPYRLQPQSGESTKLLFSLRPYAPTMGDLATVARRRLPVTER